MRYLSQDKVGKRVSHTDKDEIFTGTGIVFAKNQRQECAWYVRERTRRSVLLRYRVSLTKKKKKKKK